MCKPNERPTKPFPLPAELGRILAETRELGQAFLVGGCVRDWCWGLPIQEVDVEVFGLNYEQLVAVLSRWGRTDLVGRSFGVVKLATAAGVTYDFTIPRRDSKIAPGHKGFEITFDPDITPAEAAARRDFTINALMYDPRRKEILDFFGGRADLESRVLRHASVAFIEDPLRVLRGMQLAARFELSAAPETVALSRSIRGSFAELAVERVRDEWFKWAQKGVRPSCGLRFLAECGWVGHFPEIEALLGTPQDPEWHPEGDVFVHTCHCCDALAALPAWRGADPESRAVYMLATLAHDFGKPSTTQTAERNGQARIVSPGHEEAGGPLTEQFLRRIHAPRAVQERVLPLVLNHLAHLQPLSDRSVRRLARRLIPESIQGLCLVMIADHFGRPPRPAAVPETILALQRKAEELTLQTSAPRPILMGRHLLALGLRPGPEFKLILDAAFEAQLEGRFQDLEGAQLWLAAQSDLPLTSQARAHLPAPPPGQQTP